MNTISSGQIFARCITSQPTQSSAIDKADKRMILAVRQAMWDLWWTKWHWTAFFTNVLVLRRQLLFHLFIYFFHLSII